MRSMRTSSRKTPAAILREIIGIKVPEWAEILERSPHSVHDLECGRLKLSPALATKINYETGISIGWLMDGNPSAPPVAQDGREYTKAIYDEVQAKHFTMPAAFGSFTLSGQDVDLTTVDNNWAIGHNALQFCGNICAILVSANRKRKYDLACYRLAKAIQELGTSSVRQRSLTTTSRHWPTFGMTRISRMRLELPLDLPISQHSSRNRNHLRRSTARNDCPKPVRVTRPVRPVCNVLQSPLDCYPSEVPAH